MQTNSKVKRKKSKKKTNSPEKLQSARSCSVVLQPQQYEKARLVKQLPSCSVVRQEDETVKAIRESAASTSSSSAEINSLQLEEFVDMKQYGMYDRVKSRARPIVEEEFKLKDPDGQLSVFFSISHKEINVIKVATTTFISISVACLKI